MSQMDVKRIDAAPWDFLEPAMDPNRARTIHGKLKAAGAGLVIAYRAGQILLGKNDGSNEYAKIGTSGYAGRPRIMKYSVLVNEDGEWQMTNLDTESWDDHRHVHGPGSVDMYYCGYFKTQDLTGAGGTNEVQTLTFDADVDGGTYKLGFGPYETAPIAWDANAAAIEDAIDLLPNLDDGDVEVTGSGPFTFTFGGNYAGSNVPMLTIDKSGLTDGGGAVVGDTTAFAETTPGAGLLTGVGRLVSGTSVAGIVDLGVGAPS